MAIEFLHALVPLFMAFPERPFHTSIFPTKPPPFPGNLEHLNSFFNTHLKGYLAWYLPLPSPCPTLPYPIPLLEAEF